MSAFIIGTRPSDNKLYRVSGSAWTEFSSQPPGSTLAAGVWGGPDNTIWCHNAEDDSPDAKYLFFNGSVWSEYDAPSTGHIALGLHPACITGSDDGSKVYAGLSSGNFEGSIHRWDGFAWSEALVGQRVGSIWCDETGQYVWATNAGGTTWVGSPTLYYSDDYGVTWSNVWSGLLSDLGTDYSTITNPRTSGVWGLSPTEIYVGFGWDDGGPVGYLRAGLFAKWDGVSWTVAKKGGGPRFGLGNFAWTDQTNWLISGSFSPMEVWHSNDAVDLEEVLPQATGEIYDSSLGRGLQENDGSLYITLPGSFGQNSRTKVSTDGGATWPTTLTNPWGSSTEGIECLSLAGWVTQFPPYLDNRSPEPDAANVITSQVISFDLLDVNDDIDLSSTKIYINGLLAWDSNSPTTGYTGNVVAISGGYTYTIVPVDQFVPGLQTVQVFGYDLNDNSVESNWSFSVISQQLLHKINVNSVNKIYFPKPIRRLNQFDEHGSLLSLPRLRREKNWQYKRRIQDAAVNIANSSYRGLVNGITRELGLSLFKSITINPKINQDGSFVASDPYILFDGVWLLLYSDYSQRNLDWAIDRFQPGGNYEHLTNLVDAINNTSVFEANIYNSLDPYTKSMSIINQSNRRKVKVEILPQSTRFKLKHSRLVPGSVFFSNRDTFRNEKESVSLVVGKGDFHINYQKAIVTSYSMPKPQEHARYQYVVYPFNALASPVILHNINNENFQVKLFKQVQQENGNLTNGVPTELGADIINELMTVSPLYWGI